MCSILTFMPFKKLTKHMVHSRFVEVIQTKVLEKPEKWMIRDGIEPQPGQQTVLRGNV